MAVPPPPPGGGFSGVISVVAATVALAGAVLTTIGITAGVITGLLRNDTVMTGIFLVVALVGVLLGVLSAFVGGGGLGGGLAIAGVLLLFVGVGVVVGRAAQTLKTTSRPSIAVTVTPLEKPAGYATLEAKVTASGMTTQKRYYIHAELLNPEQQPVNRPVYTTFVGPGEDGKVDYTFKVEFPVDSRAPWIAVTAQLSAEGEPLIPTQVCGLPVQRPSSTPSASPVPSGTPPRTGTTCAFALAPVPSTSSSATSSRSPSRSSSSPSRRASPQRTDPPGQGS